MKIQNTYTDLDTGKNKKKVDVSDSTRIIYTQSNFAFEQLLSVECPDTNTNKTEGQMQIKHNCKNCSHYSQHLREYVMKRAFDRLKYLASFTSLLCFPFCCFLLLLFFSHSILELVLNKSRCI